MTVLPLLEAMGSTHIKYVNFAWPAMVVSTWSYEACKKCYMAAQVTGCRETVLSPSIQLWPSDPTVPFKLGRRRFAMKIVFVMAIRRAQGQTLKCIYHRLFVPMASSLWHFCERLNLTLSLLQTLGIIDNVWKTDMFIKNVGLCISRSASLVFQVYKEICVHWIFRCFCVRSIRAGTTMYWTDTTR